MAYADLLKHPNWQKKRLEILSRDNFTCQSCLSKEKTLHVHHFKYDKNPWDIQNRFLITLCEDCHYDEESIKNGLWDELIKMSSNYSVLLKDVLEIIIQIMDNADNDKSKSFRDHFIKAKNTIKENG